MCLLSIKPAGKAMPSYEIIRAAWQRNPNGGGFVTPTRVFHSMDFFEFYNALRQVPKNEPCIWHVRWATHGSVKVENCHPFVDHESGVSFAHNGILNIKPIGDWTDSETAFRTVLLPIIKKHGYRSKELREAVDKMIGWSKFAFMQGRVIQTFGHFDEVDGNLYSNLHFVSYLRNVNTYMKFKLAS